MEEDFFLTGSMRHASRIAAVQVLYKIEQSPSSVEDAVFEFISFYYLQNQSKSEKMPIVKMDELFMKNVVTVTESNKEEIDALIELNSSREWDVSRIPAVLRSILRAAIAEIMFIKIPGPIVISEYLEVTKDFFDNSEVSFVNGILDEIYRSKFLNSCSNSLALEKSE